MLRSPDWTECKAILANRQHAHCAPPHHQDHAPRLRRRRDWLWCRDALPGSPDLTAQSGSCPPSARCPGCPASCPLAQQSVSRLADPWRSKTGSGRGLTHSLSAIRASEVVDLSPLLLAPSIPERVRWHTAQDRQGDQDRVEGAGGSSPRA